VALPQQFFKKSLIISLTYFFDFAAGL